jgi:hypothetical protein
MTRGDLKTSRTGCRTPFQILADYYQTADSRDRDLWHEYARAVRGLAAVRWSRQLRAAMLSPSAAPEKTDRELAADDTKRRASIQVPCRRHLAAGLVAHPPRGARARCPRRGRKLRRGRGRLAHRTDKPLLSLAVAESGS